MMSYRLNVSGNRKAAARFVRKVHSKIRGAYEHRKNDGVNQTRIAEALGVHRSVISRQLRGAEDMTLGRVAELAWALGYRAELNLIDTQDTGPSNHVSPVIPAVAGTSTTFAANVQTTTSQWTDPSTKTNAKIDKPMLLSV